MSDDTNTHGADAPGANLTPTHGVWLVIGSAALGLVALAIIFRRPVGD